MPKTRINCPNCRQPIVAEIDQLFDSGTDPSAKQKILSGAANFVQCPLCGYQGGLATPIVYHDPQKELLLTYFPPELGLPINEQERIIGPLITKVMNDLPQEKRKGYLLRPQTMFTLQGLVERILEADGITKEMIQAQQQRLNLIQRLLSASESGLDELAKQEDASIDSAFFTLLSRLTETAAMSGDEESARRLSELQNKLIERSTFGMEYKKQTQEVEKAIKSLQGLGKEVTRDKLLDLVISAPNDTQLSVIVSMARPGMDYVFFQSLSDRIDRARGDGRSRLIELREKLLTMTQEIDKQIEARRLQARQNLTALLAAKNIEEAIAQNLPAIDQFFLEALQDELEKTRKTGDLERIGKLKQIEAIVQQASAPPPELELIEELLDSPDEGSLKAALEAHKAEITPEFMDTLTAVVQQVQNNQDPELVARLQMVYRLALRYSMAAKM